MTEVQKILSGPEYFFCDRFKCNQKRSDRSTVFKACKSGISIVHSFPPCGNGEGLASPVAILFLFHMLFTGIEAIGTTKSAITSSA